jgi:hypothetical protein
VLLQAEKCESVVWTYEVYCFVNLEIKFDCVTAVVALVAAKSDAEHSVSSLHPEII